MTSSARKNLLIIAGGIVLVCVVWLIARRYMQQGPTGPSMKLSSTSFPSDGDISTKFTCDGADVSPALTWAEPPAETRSFALIADDPDAPAKTWVHWVLYDVPASTRSLPEGVPKDAALADGSRQGKNDFDSIGYNGPCPPRGSTHHYFFKLYALDSTIELKPNPGKEDLERAMEGHILAETELIGRFQH